MNYFEIFEIPLSFEVDKKSLTSRYYELNKKYHPDNFSQATAQEQAVAVARSSNINEAYKILKSRQSRIKYVLELCGVSFVEGKEQMPQEFLMNMMEINEAIMEYKMDETSEARLEIEKQIGNFSQGLEVSARDVMVSMDLSQPKEEHLQQVKSYFLKSKYLKRLLDNLEDRGVEM